jgi:hypothetical protein
VGPARYEDLNSDLPVCITQDFLLIQTVTGLGCQCHLQCKLKVSLTAMDRIKVSQVQSGSKFKHNYWRAESLLLKVLVLVYSRRRCTGT